MKPSRRETLAAAVALLVPSWLVKPAPRAVNLEPFCHKDDSIRWNMTRPFIQGEGELFRYATDARIALRVPATPEDREDDSGLSLPPACKLPWEHDQRRGWRPWPAEAYQMADDASCLECGGYGTLKPEGECPKCQGLGEIDADPAGLHDYFRMVPCKDCNGNGHAGPPCPACGGKAIGRFPAHQPLGKLLVAARYDRLLRKHVGEMEYLSSEDVKKPVLLRGANVLGLLMPLEITGRKS